MGSCEIGLTGWSARSRRGENTDGNNTIPRFLIKLIRTAPPQSLKPILHALLISGTLPQLSLSGNRKLRSQGWRMVAAYIKKVSRPFLESEPHFLMQPCLQARALRFLDLSSNNLDKKSVEYLSQALSIGTTLASAEIEAALIKSREEDESDDSEAEERYGPIPCVSHSTLLKNCHLSGQDAPGALQTLRLDDCSLRTASLDVLGERFRHRMIWRSTN